MNCKHFIGPSQSVTTTVSYCGPYVCPICEIEQLQVERDAAVADAERYRWLRDKLHGAKAGGGLTVNDELQVYEAPIPGEEVRIYWYPDTPVGHYEQRASTLDAAIDAARGKT